MTQPTRGPLHLELLEDRWVPATVRLVNGSLFISNPIINGGSSSLLITQTATNTWQVVDGSATLGTYASVGNLYITGNNAADHITVDLNGNAYSGNLFINSGNGNDTITVTSLPSAGSIAGNVTVLTGLGNDFTSINPGNSNGQNPVTIGGNVQITSKGGNDSFTLGRPDVTANDYEGAITTVGGNVFITNVANVGLGEGDTSATVGGSLVIQDDGLQTPTNIIAHNSFTVVGNTIIDTGNGSAAITVEGTTALGSSTQLSLGNGNNSVALSSGLFSTTTVAGDFSLTEGNGNNTLTVANDSEGGGVNIQGNAALKFGDGNNTVTAAAGQQLAINGNLTVTAGNGNNAFDLTGGTVDGTLNFVVGNGNDSATVVNAPAGQLTYNSGNGNNELTLAPTVASYWNLLAKFSTGSDTLNLAGTGSAALSGSADFGGPPGDNMFLQGNNWTLVSFALMNL